MAVHPSLPDGCDDGDCALAGVSEDRRAFIRGAAAALGALALLGCSNADAMGFPMRLVHAVRLGGTARFPIPAGDGAMFDDATGIVIVRRGALAWAFLVTCPHKAIVKLRWITAEDRFQCPKHESKYRPDGTFISGKATRSMDRLPIHKDDSALIVDVDTVFESDKDPKGWAAAVASL